MKEIIVNRECVVSRSDIAPVKEEYRDTAICITQKVEDEQGFINYMLAIENGQSCCEWYDSGFIKLIDFDENNVFISKVVHNDKSDKVKEIVRKGIEAEHDYIMYDGDIIRTSVYGKNGELLVVAYVFNEHNGYYSHDVYCTVDNKIEVEYL